MKHSKSLAIALLIVGIYSTGVAVAKKPADSTPKPPVATNVDAAKAEVSATLALAGIKVSRMAIADDAGLADVKDTVSGIYDRQESATKAGLDSLRAASGDSAKVAAAVAAINAADDESVRYFAAHADVKDKISKRVTILNAEIGQIARTPDAYNALLTKCGLSGATLTQAKALVKDASQKAGGRTDGDSATVIHTAIDAVRKLLTPKQASALDSSLSGR